MILFFKKQTYSFYSSLTNKEFLTKLYDSFSKKSTFRFMFGKKNRDILGKIMSDNKFSIYARTRFGDNPFYPIFKGQLIQDGINGTKIEGIFQLHPFMKWSLIIGVSISLFSLIVTGAIYIIGTLRNDVQQVEDAIHWLPFTIILLGALPLAYVLRIPMINSDKKAIIKFIEDSCQATPIQPFN